MDKQLPIVSRRNALQSMGCGFGFLAAAGLANSEAATASSVNPLLPKMPHFAPRAKRVIFIFMQGGPSHVDTFDYKPRLAKDNDKMLVFDDARVLAKTKKIIKTPCNRSIRYESPYRYPGRFIHLFRLDPLFSYRIMVIII